MCLWCWPRRLGRRAGNRAGNMWAAPARSQWQGCVTLVSRILSEPGAGGVSHQHLSWAGAATFGHLPVSMCCLCQTSPLSGKEVAHFLCWLTLQGTSLLILPSASAPLLSWHVPLGLFSSSRTFAQTLCFLTSLNGAHHAAPVYGGVLARLSTTSCAAPPVLPTKQDAAWRAAVTRFLAAIQATRQVSATTSCPAHTHISMFSGYTTCRGMGTTAQPAFRAATTTGLGRTRNARRTSLYDKCVLTVQTSKRSQRRGRRTSHITWHLLPGGSILPAAALPTWDGTLREMEDRNGNQPCNNLFTGQAKFAIPRLTYTATRRGNNKPR